MKWISDSLNRFSQRPWYEQEEIDKLCQDIICDFLRSRNCEIAFPVSTSDLTVLVEQHTSDLDHAADLSMRGSGVEGVTDFVIGAKPVVLIDEKLSMSDDLWAQYRFRSTMMHEFGHVIFHDALVPLVLDTVVFNETNLTRSCSCNETSMSLPQHVDWMEWQASYAASAFLMPVDSLLSLTNKLLKEWRAKGRMCVQSPTGKDIISQVKKTFCVSPSAAKVRLLQLEVLSEAPGF